MIQRFCLLCLVSIFFNAQLWGQSSPQAAEAKGIQLGIHLDGITYRGDYLEGAGSMRVQPGGHLTIQSARRRSLKFQAALGFGEVSEQTDGTINLQATPSFFTTPFWYGNLGISWQPNLGRFTPILTLGAGLIHFSPRDQQGRTLQPRRQTRAAGEDYNPIIPQLPASLGVAYQINQQLAASFSYSYRFVPSDFLDNVGQSGPQPGFDALQSLSLGLRLTISPNPSSQTPSEPSLAEPLPPQDVMSLNP